MAIKVFVTGVTGYVGGDALAVIYSKHPDWHYRLLVRGQTKAPAVLTAFPKAEIVQADLDSLDTLYKEAAEADIVLHFASSDHNAAAQALIDGLASRDASRPGFLVHVSGTGLLVHSETSTGNIGGPNGRIYDDVADIDELLNFPDEAFHRPVDKLVQQAPDKVHRLIVCPPAIAGTGRGPVNTRSVMLPVLAHEFQQRGAGFQIGSGQGQWTYVHIHDLAELFLAIAEDAARLVETHGKPDPQVWGREGYFFTGGRDFTLGDMARLVASAMHAQAPAAVADPRYKFDTLSIEEASAMSIMFAVVAANSRSRGTRARKHFGWKPLRDDWEGVVNDAVEYEIKHAKSSRMDELMAKLEAAGALPSS